MEMDSGVIYMMLANKFNQSLPHTLFFSLLGILMVLLTAYNFQSMPVWLHLLNRGAIPILALHGVALHHIMSYYVNVNPQSPLFSSGGYALWSAVVLLCFIPIIWALLKILPIACGEKKK